MSRIFELIIVATAIAAWAFPASAGPVALDFTNASPWVAANNQTSFSTVIGGVTVTLTASGGNSTPKITLQQQYV
ncbi:MAG: hypothetical protein FJX59_08525 [Alphaproteobacteria bacterium]|nr:hypothetical protein [Alphaproteobacteria bacterium]